MDSVLTGSEVSRLIQKKLFYADINLMRKSIKKFILMVLMTGAIQHAKGDTITVMPDGKITFNPPFSMSHHEDPSPELPITSVTYTIDNSPSTNGDDRISFIGTTTLWMVRNPSAFTNRVTTIKELKELIDTTARSGSAGTNILQSIIKFQGQDAVESAGYFSGTWHDQVIMYWGRPKDWNNNIIFVIDSQAANKETCKKLITAVTVDPPKSN